MKTITIPTLKNRINLVFGNNILEHPLSVYESLERHGSRGHQRLYTKSELVDLLNVYGFEILKTWCIDNKPPLLSLSRYKSVLPRNFDFDLFDKFWKENKSFKGKVRRNIEIYLNSSMPNFYENIYILARRTSEFSKDRFYETIKKSDPWMDMEKFKLK